MQQSQQTKQRFFGFPFVFGCFSGVFLTLIFLSALFIGGFMFVQYQFGNYVSQNFENQIKPTLEQHLPLAPREKQKVIHELEVFLKKFPEMSIEEKQEALKRWQEMAQEWNQHKGQGI